MTEIKLKIPIIASIAQEIEFHNKGFYPNKFDLKLEFPEGLEADFKTRDGYYSELGTMVFSNAMIDGLVANIIQAQRTKVKDPSEHLRWAIDEIKKRFIDHDMTVTTFSDKKL